LLGLFCGTQLQAQKDLSEHLPSDFDALDYKEKFALLDSMRQNGERPYEVNIGIALKGYELARLEGDLYGNSLWTRTASRLYGNLGLYNEAENYALISLENARADENTEFESAALLRLARTKIDLQQFDEAIAYVESGIEKAGQAITTDREGLGWAWNMKGEIFRLSGMSEEAIGSYEKAAEEFDKYGIDAGKEAISHNMGLAQAAAGNYDQAKILLNTDMHTYIAYDPARKMEYYLGMAEVLVGSDSLEKAVFMAQTGLAYADSIDSKRWKVSSLNKLADLEKKRNQWQVAWDYREEAIQLSEEVLGERVRSQSEVMGIRFDLDQMEAENQLLVQTNKNQQLFTRGLVAIGILVLLIVSILVYSFLKTRKYNAKLSQRNDQLDQLIQEKDTLMNIMAHDLKAPLHAIGGMMELIRDPNTPPQVKDACIGKVEIALERESALISNLLEMAALESGQIGAKMRTTPLSEVVEKVLEENLAQAQHKQIALEYKKGQGVNVHTDPTLAGRILNNLLSNAIKYSPKGEPVSIRVVDKARAVEIQVEDKGPGLSQDDKTNLFKKFKTLSAKPTGGESSTGLGLALAWALSKKINGTISVNSTLGQGSVFSLTLPKTS